MSKVLQEQIDLHFDGVDKMKELLAHHVSALFGGGWVWICVKNGQLDIITTQAGHSLLSLERGDQLVPVFGIDACEHAYMSEYGHDIDAYVDAWWKVQDLIVAEDIMVPAMASAGIEIGESRL